MTDDAWAVTDGTPFRRLAARVRVALADQNTVALGSAVDEAMAAERDTQATFCLMLAMFAWSGAVAIEDDRSDLIPVVDACVRKLAEIAHGGPDQG